MMLRLRLKASLILDNWGNLILSLKGEFDR